MSDPRSALLAVVNRNFDGVDIDGLAAALGLSVKRLKKLDPHVGSIVGAGLLDDGPALIVGTGNLHFDAEVAAALGLPILLLTDRPGRHIQLAERHAKELEAVVAAAVTEDGLRDVVKIQEALHVAEVAPVMSAPVFENWLLERAKKNCAHIVLPEGEDDRILLAAHQLLARNVVELTILGDPAEIKNRADELGVDLSDADIVNHHTSPLAEEFAEDFVELRKKKGVPLEEARETMKDISYFGTMMVHKGLADGMVSGAAHTTAHTIKPSFQIIKTTPDASVVSSIFLMVLRGRLWAFGDCAVNPNPSAEQLGEIAVVSAKTASQFGIDPRVAILSYSTGASGTGADVDRAVEALGHARRINPDLCVDGPLQFDAAVDPGVARKKMPDSDVAGHANVFVFPDLEAGNIGYKTAQRTGSALAVGPILQGLNKPVNDLSRGATVPDIVNTVAITAIQAGGKQ
ncbi:phosphate acetyltransferase [Corynebacterium halotolerans]|uniref:Phosphate acetyltransferase n=1 Tax=Corynebacterium halotolerans YIM 70093 = DSM 44683 TaxID=1121362 RepID=M1PA24_9CORY|nr:phosphate acetyltransferase [Corynebacterium halotolerans]AGF73501.1 phosphotransacetylase [Corynebacterium halotolerans YIM 70093 = DSM 44683]